MKFLSCFMVNMLKDFCVISVAREKKSKLVPLSATGKPTPPTNAVTETISTVTGDVIRPISAIFVIALNFFANCLENLVL